MLRTIRLTTALICFTLVTLLFLDFTGTLHAWFGWLAKVQFLPAVLALNLGVVLFLIVLTWIFGRVYCSVICPLGIFQDVVSWLAGPQPLHLDVSITGLKTEKREINPKNVPTGQIVLQ